MSTQGYESDLVILRFPRTRGRPRKQRPARDLGTPELTLKRLMGETAEALDLCLDRGIITSQNHWCGIHLRWLYTLRHGAPSVRAIDPTHLGGIENKQDDPQWRAARELEYHEAVRQLAPRGLVQALMNLCVYNDRPRFLSLRQEVTPKRLEEATRSIAQIREGLDILVKLWKRCPKETD